MLLGAHLSIAGGYDKALGKAALIGANCLQIFSASPRGWNFAEPSDETADEFKRLKKKCEIDPVYFHASYLINLADKGSVGHLSVKSLTAELKAAKKLGVKGSIVHLGSFKDGGADDPEHPLYDTLLRRVKEVLAATPEETLFVIENSGTRKIGRKLEQISDIIRSVKSKRLRVALDTCHLHSAGYDICSAKGLDAFLKEFDILIGLWRLEVIHLNDSRDPFASLRDRHENIGNGTLGLAPFRLILNYPKLRRLPFIIETPGFDDRGPDKKNLDILKSLV